MSARKVFCLVLFAALITAMPAASWAINGVQSVEVTGAFYNTVRRNTNLCAQITPAIAGIPVRFTGIRPDGITATAGPVLTDATGRACRAVDWWQGVYTVRAQANGTTSPPVAVLVIIDPFCGAAGGGQMEVSCYGVPPNVQMSATRRTTVAFAWEFQPKTYFGLVYYDNDNPLGAICFMATSYRTRSLIGNGCEQATFTGYGLLTQGNNPPRYVSYTAIGVDCPDYSLFRLLLKDFAGRLIYDSLPCATGPPFISGKVVINPCLPG